MADVVRERIQTNRKVETSGIVINTCGWVRGEGYNQLKHIAQAFEVFRFTIRVQNKHNKINLSLSEMMF